MLTGRQLAGVIVAALLLVLAAGLVTHWAGPTAPDRLPPCVTEDSPGAATGPCYWDARTRGNHQGRSFTASPEGTAP